jgi:hypothetical protein
MNGKTLISHNRDPDAPRQQASDIVVMEEGKAVAHGAHHQP